MALLKYYDQIIAYDSGQLSLVEKNNFEQKLANDSTLKKELEAYQAAKEVGNYLAYLETKSLLQKIGTTRKKSTKWLTFVSKKWAFAAAISLLIGLASWYFYLQQNDTKQKLATEYYYALDFSEVRSGKTQETIFQTAMDAYHANKYQQTLRILNNLSVEKTTEAELLKGYCFFNLEQPKNAIIAFSFVIQQNDSRFKDNAQWQLALCHLMLGETDKATQILNTFTISTIPFYSNRAKELLPKIKD